MTQTVKSDNPTFYRYKKSLWLFLPIIFLLAAVLISRYRPSPVIAPTGDYLVANGKIISLEIARTPVELTRGLSGHPAFSDDHGMLFIFPGKEIRSFWMKEMLFGLDIIWLDGSRVVKISGNLPPEGKSPQKIYSSEMPIDRVLEVNAGWSARHGLSVGDIVSYNLLNR